jgi:hypothetical protein
MPIPFRKQPISRAMPMTIRLESYEASADIHGERLASQLSERVFDRESMLGNLAASLDIEDDMPGDFFCMSRSRSAAPVGLAARIQLLIRVAGSMAAIARRCGFSQGAVRSWRDGHTDISRERCVVMARTFNVSLVWLMTGEGPMREPPARVQFRDDSIMLRTAPASAAHRPVDEERSSQRGTPSPALKPRVLAAALRLLQSYIGLLGGSLNPNERADALVELYEILSTPDAPGHTDRLIAFHAALNTQLRRARPFIA